VVSVRRLDERRSLERPGGVRHDNVAKAVRERRRSVNSGQSSLDGHTWRKSDPGVGGWLCELGVAKAERVGLYLGEAGDEWSVALAIASEGHQDDG